MIDAYQPGVPLYIRWTWQEKVVKPIYISSNNPDNFMEPKNKAKNIELKHR